jgi:hypothetical protein
MFSFCATVLSAIRVLSLEVPAPGSAYAHGVAAVAAISRTSLSCGAAMAQRHPQVDGGRPGGDGQLCYTRRERASAHSLEGL